MRLPLTVSLRPSRSLAVAVLAAHLLAAVAIVVSLLPVAAKLSLALLLTLSLAVSLRRPTVKSLILNSDGDLTLVFVDGRECKGRVALATTVFPWLVVMRVYTAVGTESLVLPVDALGTESHRRLRVWLKWKTNAVASA
jgi:hypothetical protein